MQWKVFTIALVCALFALTVGCGSAMFADGGSFGADVKLDETGEKLIPPEAERVDVSRGNLTLRYSGQYDTLLLFYNSALKDLGAVGSVISNPVARPGEAQMLSKWNGIYQGGKRFDVTIYRLDEITYSIAVSY